jgi:hypothetical protein
MIRRGLATPIAGLLALGLCLAATVNADDDDDKKKAVAAAQKDVLELVPKVGSVDLAKQGEVLGKKHALVLCQSCLVG